MINIFKTPSILLIVGAFFLTSCSSQDPESYYKNHIPFLSKVSYHDLNDFKIISDSLYVDLWFSQDSVIGVDFRRIGGIEQVADNKIWISDPLLGYLYEFDSAGVYLKEIARSGNGPGELGAPLLIDFNEKERLVGILDTRLKFISLFDIEGKEISRFSIKSIPPSFQVNDFKFISSNHFMVPNLQEKNYLIFNYDSLGNKSNGFINRMVPIGMQPFNYNSVYFDFKDSLLAYSYDGIPLIFLKKDLFFSTLNLMPGSKLSDINVPLEFKPINERVSVKKIIKGIFLNENSIYVFFVDHFFKIPQNLEGEVKKVYLYDSQEKTPLYYHDVEFFNDSFYLINRYYSTIHKL